MDERHCYAVIMAGGSGSRFWPISREAEPKQFLRMDAAGKTLLRSAYERFLGLIRPENILVVTVSRYLSQVREIIPEMPAENILLEPYSRNTAPCIAFAAYKLLRRDPSAVMVVCPSDHLIGDREAFRSSVGKALSFVSSQDALVTLGVVPTRPDTNFGYIQMASEAQEGEPVKVKTFTEKPDSAIAEIFYQSGEFLWNTGIFAWKASFIKYELEKYTPEITARWEGWEDELDGPGEEAFLHRIYGDCPRTSIDYAVMEKADRAWVIPSTFRWADIGNWESLYENLSHVDAEGNAVDIRGAMISRHNSGNIVFSRTDGKLTVISGLENYIIVDTDDVLMICPRDEEKLKELRSLAAMPEFEKYR